MIGKNYRKFPCEHKTYSGDMCPAGPYSSKYTLQNHMRTKHPTPGTSGIATASLSSPSLCSLFTNSLPTLSPKAPAQRDLDSSELSAFDDKPEVMEAAIQEQNELLEELLRLSREVSQPALIKDLQDKLERFKIMIGKQSDGQK